MPGRGCVGLRYAWSRRPDAGPARTGGDRLRLVATELTEGEQALREQVRAFLAERLPVGSYQPGLGMAGEVDPQFSRDLGARGWLGMTLPKEYGGGGRSAVDRLVVVEELL